MSEATETAPQPKPGMTDDEWAMAHLQARAQAMNFAMNMQGQFPTADNVLKVARAFHAFLVGCEDDPDEGTSAVSSH